MAAAVDAGVRLLFSLPWGAGVGCMVPLGGRVRHATSWACRCGGWAAAHPIRSGVLPPSAVGVSPRPPLLGQDGQLPVLQVLFAPSLGLQV